MKTLNAKRIAAVVAGAALLGVGLAFAGPITFQNVPIISNSGQPVVQIVLGSSSKPSDGVAAANIAAAIGNLAYTSVPVTASVNATQAQSVLHVAVSSPKYTLSNQQVYLNESGAVGSSAGTYVFSALIGSVLNGAVILNSPQNTKTLQGTGQYSYPHSSTIASSPAASPFTTAGSVPYGSVNYNNNGGGVSFTTGFTQGGQYDNIMEITSSQYPSLLSNFGGNGESTYLWLTGFPVFDQGTPGSPVDQFQLVGAGGAYQATFSSPISNTVSSGGTSINVPIRLLGQNWTILNATGPSSSVGSSSTVAGGKMYIASSLIPLTTVYVGHNLTSGPWTIELQDLGQPNASGVSPASISVLYNNVLTNTSSVNPHTTAKFNVTGHTLYVNVNQTFAGLYAYQKWAKIQFYTNVYEVQNGKVFNQTTNPGWISDLLWTNTSSSSGSAKYLQSIILYNSSPTTLNVGQSFTYIQNPQKAKVTFLGDTLGAGSTDTVTISSPSTQTNVQYKNLGSTFVGPGGTIQNVTEPAAELVVTSQIPNAFSFVGQTSSSVTYDLTPYELNEVGNTLQAATAQSAGSGNTAGQSAVTLQFTNPNGANWITSTYPLQVSVTGWTSNSQPTATTQTLQFSTNSLTAALPSNVFNVTAIEIVGSRALPGNMIITVNGIAASNAVNTVVLADLKNTGPGVLYTQSGQNLYTYALSLTAPGNVIYNQQNGQPTNTFVLASASALPTTTGIGQYFTYTVGEQAVPSNSAAVDGLSIGIDNSSAGVGVSPLFQLNYSNSGSGAAGTKNNVTYTSSTQSAAGVSMNVQAGFRTEKGSKVVAITPSLVTFNLAKVQDWLEFSVSAANSTTTTSKSYKMYGPYGVGQATNLPNVSIGSVNASIKLSSTNYTVSGIANLTATPSVSSATQPVLLTNLTTTPLVVLDSQANPGSNLILVGSGYVNTLSAQLQQSYNISMTPTTQITQAYGTNRVLVAGYYANQTQAAANSFIQQLYAQAK